MKTIKQILLIGVIFSMTAFCVFAQSGTRCDDPLVAKLGDNLFSTVGEEVRWYTYEATRDGKITIASCEQTTDDTQVKIYTGSIC